MEGPSLVILHEELLTFLGKKVLKVRGNTKQSKELLKGRLLESIDTWGKVLFLSFSDPQKKAQPILTKTHFLLFGSYRINEPKENRSPRLELQFANGTVYFYSSSLQFNAEDYLHSLDREVDLMSPDWNDEHVIQLMKKKKDALLCDLFLEQSLFAGSGNIVKNEVLFNIRRHPLTPLSCIDKRDWVELAWAVREYCFHFYEWKKKFELRKHWQVYRKSICPICGGKIKREKLGKFSRMSFYCPHCQKLSSAVGRLKVYPVIPFEGESGPEEKIDH
jgi:endonuclease-8